MVNNSGASGTERYHENQAFHVKSLWIDGTLFEPSASDVTGTAADNAVVRGNGGGSAIQGSSMILWDEMTVTTTDGTATTISTIPIATDTEVIAHADVKALRTGGSSGAAGDAASYVVQCGVNNIAGIVRIVGQNSTLNSEDQAGWGAAFSVSGTNILLRVTGAANNTVRWTATLRTI